MELEIDPDVKAVAEFMQSQIAASRLVPVAEAIAAIAPILWENFEPENVAALRLKALPINAARAEHKPQDARSPDPARACAGDGSAAEAS